MTEDWLAHTYFLKIYSHFHNFTTQSVNLKQVKTVNLQSLKYLLLNAALLDGLKIQKLWKSMSYVTMFSQIYWSTQKLSTCLRPFWSYLQILEFANKDVWNLYFFVTILIWRFIRAYKQSYNRNQSFKLKKIWY